MPTDRQIDTLATYFEEQCLLHEQEGVDIDTFIDIADSAIQYAKAVLEAAEAVNLDIRESRLGDILYGSPPEGE